MNESICIYPPIGSLKFGEGKDRFGKLWRWEFYEYNGPGFLRSNGELLKKQPGENSPAWDPFYDWFYHTFPEKFKDTPWYALPYSFSEGYARKYAEAS